MFTRLSLIQKYLGKPGGRFYVLYADFQKAFDGLFHHSLFTCLHQIGLNENILRVLLSTKHTFMYLSALIPKMSLNPFTVIVEPDKGT